MRPNRLALITTVAVLFGGVIAGAPLAGAAGATGHAFRAVGAVTHSDRPGITSPVTPISSGYLEVTDDTGATTLTPGTVPTPTIAGNQSDLVVQLVAPSFPGQIPGEPMNVDISMGTSGIPLKVGQIYGTGTVGSVTVTSTNNCGSDVVGDSASAIIDQLTTVGGEVTSAAVRFACAAGAGPYLALYGAIAYNAVPSAPHSGYYSYEANGAITSFGNDAYLSYLGDLSVSVLNKPVVGMAQTADGGGYWMVASDGGIFAYGDAGFYGSAGNLSLNEPIVGMAATPDGKGYWLVASDGGIFAYGDATFYGSAGSLSLNKPVVGMAATRDGKGYWLVASDGGVFAYGDATFYGSTGSIQLNKPVVGMTSTLDGKGYWFVASDGGIFAYGDATFHGSTGNITLAQPVVGMAITADGSGYWMTAADGGIFAFNAPTTGAFPALVHPSPMSPGSRPFRASPPDRPTRIDDVPLTRWSGAGKECRRQVHPTPEQFSG
jgi:ligand-binding sensor domain-containing protein